MCQSWSKQLENKDIQALNREREFLFLSVNSFISDNCKAYFVWITDCLFYGWLAEQQEFITNAGQSYEMLVN
jgi:hypothetical protein